MAAPPPSPGASPPSPGAAVPAERERAPAVTDRASRNGSHPATPSTGSAAAPKPGPFLKWAGGKGQLLPELLRRVPQQLDGYYEPMVGGGALFFALAGDEENRPRPAVLNDANADLVSAYTVVRDRVEALIGCLEEYGSTYLAADAEERARLYYEVRAAEPDGDVERAARLLFLNRTCFNGLYRVNRAGRFNVPHGRYARPRILAAEALRAASRALADVELRTGDVVDACAGAGRGDLVYLDPPFFPLSATSSFTDYTAGSFGPADQARLRWLVDDLTERGACVMLSNSPHPWVLGAYESARYRLVEGRGGGATAAGEPSAATYSHHRIEEVPARRMINSRGDRRSAIIELIVTNPPLVEAIERGSAS